MLLGAASNITGLSAKYKQPAWAPDDCFVFSLPVFFHPLQRACRNLLPKGGLCGRRQHGSAGSMAATTNLVLRDMVFDRNCAFPATIVLHSSVARQCGCSSLCWIGL